MKSAGSGHTFAHVNEQGKNQRGSEKFLYLKYFMRAKFGVYNNNLRCSDIVSKVKQ